MDHVIGSGGRNLRRDPPAILTTRRLRLRGWHDDDVAALLAISSDPQVMRFFPRPMTADEVATFVAREQSLLAHGRPGLFAVERLEATPLLGFVGLAQPRFEAAFTPCVEIGWRLARAAWGHGYATEAGHAVLAHAFTTLGLPEVVSFTAVPNEPSQAVMRRLGMRYAGEFDHPALDSGDWLCRHVLFRLTAEEWAASQRRPGPAGTAHCV